MSSPTLTAVTPARILSRSQRRAMRAIALTLAVLAAAGAATGSWLAGSADTAPTLQWSVSQHGGH